MNYREKFKQQKEPEENKQIFDLENGGRNNMSGDPLRISGSQSHHLNTLKKIQNPRSPMTGQGIKPIMDREHSTRNSLSGLRQSG